MKTRASADVGLAVPESQITGRDGNYCFSRKFLGEP